MRRIFERSILGALFGLAVAGSTEIAPALAQSATTGNIINIAGDPDDFVVELSEAGQCGSRYFHIQRANTNFKEMVALSLTAFAAGKRMVVFVTGCGGDRNIISHGFAQR